MDPLPLQPPKKSLKLSRHILFIVLIILATGAMAGGVMVLQNTGSRKIKDIRLKVPFREVSPTPQPLPTIVPTIDPTLNWQTMVNNSFRLKYPDRFSITEKELPYTAAYPKIYTTIEFNDVQSLITVTTAKNSANYTLSTLMGNGPFLRYAPSIVTSDAKTTIQVAGQNAIVAKRVPVGKNGTAVDTLLISNGKIYQITLSPIDADTTTYDAILTTLVLLNNEPDDITDSWQVYTDSNYAYTVKYPKTYGIEHGKAASISALTAIFDTTKGQNATKLKIEVQDIRNIGQSDVTARSIVGLPLDQYVSKKWDYNKASDSAVPNKTISAVKEITVSGKLAYEFSVTGNYRDDRGSEKHSEAYSYIFVDNSSYKYKIWFPKADLTFNQILKTLTFTK